MKNSILFFALSLIIFSLAGCDKDDETPHDTMPPTVTNVLLNNQAPGASIAIAPGTEMDFEATFSDNIALGKYQIEIHENFDEHDHGRIKATPFEFIREYDLSGTSQTVDEHIDVPQDATPGAYHFTVSFFDAAGNEGQSVIIDFVIANPESQPVVNITSPNIEAEIEVAPGETIILEGTVTDPDGLEEVHIILAHEDGHSHGRIQEEEPIYEMEYLLEGATTFNFNAADPILVPETTPAGHYELKIIAKDVLGNITTVTAEVHVE